MSDFVKGIARLITEDPDVFSAYQDKFREHTVLDAEIFGEIVGILQDVAANNGLTLDRSQLKVRFNPSGISIKNIRLDSPDSTTKKGLADRMARVTGDDNIKNTFNKNLKVNLYHAISGEFAERVREELNLEVTHQSRDPEGSGDSSMILPMATFAQPSVTAEEPEEEFDVAEPNGPEPEGGPEVPMPDDGMGGMGGGMGGMGGGMDMGGDLEDLPEPPNEEELPAEGEGVEEPETGPFGLEPPDEEAGEEPVPEEEEPAVEESIMRIASILTEDPDIINEEPEWRRR